MDRTGAKRLFAPHTGRAGHGMGTNQSVQKKAQIVYLEGIRVFLEIKDGKNRGHLNGTSRCRAADEKSRRNNLTTTDYRRGGHKHRG